jgi:hypothetical protein
MLVWKVSSIDVVTLQCWVDLSNLTHPRFFREARHQTAERSPLRLGGSVGFRFYNPTHDQSTTRYTAMGLTYTETPSMTKTPNAWSTAWHRLKKS